MPRININRHSQQNPSEKKIWTMNGKLIALLKTEKKVADQKKSSQKKK